MLRNPPYISNKKPTVLRWAIVVLILHALSYPLIALVLGENWMPHYKVDHLREQGIDLIIIPLESRFGTIGNSEQAAEIQAFQLRVDAAGLSGTVVPVWDAGGNRMGFHAPRQWHPFFNSLSLAFVQQNLNREIFW